MHTSRAKPRGTGSTIAAVVLAVVVVAAVAFGLWWFLARDSSSSSSDVPSLGTTAATEAELESLATSVAHPIFWVGPKADTTYEVQRFADGRIYIRYLPKGVEVGSPDRYLTVGSYPQDDAFDTVTSQAHASDSNAIKTSKGEVAYYKTSHPSSVYVAFTGVPVLIEVFDPSPAEAQRIVKSGAVGSITTGSPTVPKTAAVAATPDDLKALSAKLGRPIYWAGPKVDTTYELTELPDGSIYVRYLPEGAEVGDPTPYPTVGTYPLTDAFVKVGASAALPDSIKIPVENGVAYYSTGLPASVFLAFKGGDEKVEVFDPSPADAHSTVSSGKIKPVG